MKSVQDRRVQPANRREPGTAIVADKGFSGDDFEKFLAGPGLGLTLIRPARQDEKNPRDFPNWLRYIAFSPLLRQTPAPTEAQYLLMSYAFDTLGYRRYESKCDSLNAPSHKAAQRLGFTSARPWFTRAAFGTSRGFPSRTPTGRRSAPRFKSGSRPATSTPTAGRSCP